MAPRERDGEAPRTVTDEEPEPKRPLSRTTETTCPDDGTPPVAEPTPLLPLQILGQNSSCLPEMWSAIRVLDNS